MTNTAIERDEQGVMGINPRTDTSRCAGYCSHAEVPHRPDAMKGRGLRPL